MAAPRAPFFGEAVGVVLAQPLQQAVAFSSCVGLRKVTTTLNGRRDQV
jgi:hypothetical protein